MKNENFKTVKNFEKYEINENGDVRLKGTHTFLKQKKCKKGYFYVMIRDNNNRSGKMNVHLLMATTFLNHTIKGYNMVADHIDNNKANNHLSNLQIISMRKNTSKDKCNKTSRYTGVSLHTNGKYITHIQVSKKIFHLGTFLNEDKAGQVYKDAINYCDKHGYTHESILNFKMKKETL